jgi:hypothetical protein
MTPAKLESPREHRHTSLHQCHKMAQLIVAQSITRSETWKMAQLNSAQAITRFEALTAY